MLRGRQISAEKNYYKGKIQSYAKTKTHRLITEVRHHARMDDPPTIKHKRNTPIQRASTLEVKTPILLLRLHGYSPFVGTLVQETLTQVQSLSSALNRLDLFDQALIVESRDTL